MKRILAVLAAVLLTLTVAPLPAYADAYVNTGSCQGATAHSAGGAHYVCYDISEDLIYVMSWTSNPTNNHVDYGFYAVGTLVNYDPYYSAPRVYVPYPTVGYVTSDAGCHATNVNGEWDIFYQLGTSYGLAGRVEDIQTNLESPHDWVHPGVTDSQGAILAYLVNSNSGYKCLTIP